MSLQPHAQAGQPAQPEPDAYEVLSSGKSLYRIHNLWLGPEGWTLPIGIPYLGAGAAAVAFVPAIILLGIIGLSGWKHYAAAAAVAVAVAFVVVRNSNSDRPAGALLATWFRETSAPRPGDDQALNARSGRHVMTLRALPGAGSPPALRDEEATPHVP